MLLGKGAVLVVILRREMLLFGDDTHSRRRFCAEISTFWRRASFSSSFLCRKLHFLATTPLLVVAFGRRTHFFGDDTPSRRHFVAENSLFWRRHPFSSSFCGGKLHFLATRLFLVVVFAPETSFFGDDTPYRRHFVAENYFFGDDTLSRRRFGAENSLFW
ncbi:hypothetical protein [Caldifermentibacillus hisashii]|uniref:hypothetical protein n=1 Tax=Caldifermentibacillus hisashii TaxID=996558 RepID=UPI001C0FDC4C|nr:hypothetical protein [Caldifermentibacillus hisashii]MBU5344027.1 hypothetical protein [Caldifermentibacillus hisashii]